MSNLFEVTTEHWMGVIIVMHFYFFKDCSRQRFKWNLWTNLQPNSAVSHIW